MEKIYGTVDETFDYAKTNKLLSRNHKQFIKNIACYPNRIKQDDIILMKGIFSNEEVMHFILLVSTLKMRLQLIYFTNKFYNITKNAD